MAYTKSGVYVYTMQELMKATALTTGTWNFLTAANFKLSLVLNTATDGSNPVNFSMAAGSTWVNTSEATGTAWASGGVLLSTAAATASVVPTLAEGTAGALRYDHTNDLSVTGTSVANFQGSIIYMDANTAPAALVDAMFCSTCFTGGPYTTSAGTLGIAWAATGIIEFDLTP